MDPFWRGVVNHLRQEMDSALAESTLSGRTICHDCRGINNPYSTSPIREAD